MKNRRRYDTVELVNEIKKERRNALILAMAGVGILVALLLVYMTAFSSNDVPTVPDKGVTDEELAAAEEPPTEENGAAEEKPTEEPPPEEPPPVEEKKPFTVSLVLTKKAPVWVDGKNIGKLKKKKLELDPGKHQIKAKFGKKFVTQAVTSKGGLAYELRFDAKRRKAQLKKLK